MRAFDVFEATIPQIRRALETGATTSEEVVRAYLQRVEAYDVNGPRLNALVVMNPDALLEARKSDRRRAEQRLLGPLDGIPYTAKNSYLAKGLTAAAGSPAFADLHANRDSFVIEQLKSSGAILIGLTNMPPMAFGGMQKGLYGRAESPYNKNFLTAAFASGSSNGSGTATAASFAAFGLGEETWSSGRTPASNNALCAYTPSRGVISIRGNWPLSPPMDVVVPQTRTMADLLEVLDVIVADDSDSRGDFWRVQPWVDIPKPSEVRPGYYPDLAPADPFSARQCLSGKRVGIPKMYINADPVAGLALQPGIGGPTGQPIRTRQSIIELWQEAKEDIENAGAAVELVDFPSVSNYEGDRLSAAKITTRGLVPPSYLENEATLLTAWAWDDFLQYNNDPDLNRLEQVDGRKIFPHPKGTLPDREIPFEVDLSMFPDILCNHRVEDVTSIPYLEAGLRGLEETRRIDLELWMDKHHLDAVVFPAVADVGASDMDVNAKSADAGWRNGVWVANGNLAIRHLGIPTVTVPMGTMTDIHMPVGLTFLGKAYQDTALLSLAAAFECITKRRARPPLAPSLITEPLDKADLPEPGI